MSLRVTACQAYDDRQAAGRQPSEDTQLSFLSILCCPVPALLFFTRLEMRVLASGLCKQAGTNTFTGGSHRIARLVYGFIARFRENSGMSRRSSAKQK